MLDNIFRKKTQCKYLSMYNRHHPQVYKGKNNKLFIWIDKKLLILNELIDIK